MIRKLLAAPVLVMLVFLVFGSSLTSAQTATQNATPQTAYNFEFFDFQTNASVTAFPFGHTNEIIVASQTQDVRNQLPINLSLKIDGNERWTAAIAGSPTQTCRGTTGCSTRGPIISDPGANSYLELTAKVRSGQTLATYTRGTPPTSTPKTATTNQPLSQPLSTKAQSDTISNLNDSWFQRWWLVGFWVGILWLFLWIFVGRQWAKLKFWGFSWPWPWWFWIPFIWFIPWLIIAWQWWLDWWVWWIWIWWLFPWIFWLFWWVVVFKEAMIWLWNKSK